MPGQSIDRAANLTEATSVSFKTATTTATTTGTGVSRIGKRSVTGVVQFTSLNGGSTSAGTFTAVLYESDDNSTYTAVAAADYTIYGDSDLEFSYGDTPDTRYVAYHGSKAYVNWVALVGSTPSTGVIAECRFVLQDPDSAPTNTAGA